VSIFTFVFPLVTEFTYKNRSYYWEPTGARWRFKYNQNQGSFSSGNLRNLGLIHCLLNDLARKGASEEKLTGLINGNANTSEEDEKDFPEVIARAWLKAASKAPVAPPPTSTVNLPDPSPKEVLLKLILSKGVFKFQADDLLSEFETQFPGILGATGKSQAPSEPTICTPQQSLF
jgi:hypothetical protein